MRVAQYHQYGTAITGASNKTTSSRMGHTSRGTQKKQFDTFE
jgi:hypothetical protein